METVKLVYAEDCQDEAIKEIAKMLLPKLLSMGKEKRVESLEKLNMYLDNAIKKIETNPFKYMPETFLIEDKEDAQYVFDDVLFN